MTTLSTHILVEFPNAAKLHLTKEVFEAIVQKATSEIQQTKDIERSKQDIECLRVLRTLNVYLAEAI